MIHQVNAIKKFFNDIRIKIIHFGYKIPVSISSCCVANCICPCFVDLSSVFEERVLEMWIRILVLYFTWRVKILLLIFELGFGNWSKNSAVEINGITNNYQQNVSKSFSSVVQYTTLLTSERAFLRQEEERRREPISIRDFCSEEEILKL